MHNSNILNRVRRWETLSDWIKNEVDSCQYARKEKLAIEQMMADIRRAMREPGLTDWLPEELERTLVTMSRYRLVTELKSEWWDYNILKRLIYAVKYSDKVPQEYSRWFIKRILPLKWVMWFKKKMK